MAGVVLDKGTPELQSSPRTRKNNRARKRLRRSGRERSRFGNCSKPALRIEATSAKPQRSYYTKRARAATKKDNGPTLSGKSSRAPHDYFGAPVADASASR